MHDAEGKEVSQQAHLIQSTCQRGICTAETITESSLLTRKALEASLSAPHVPPIGTAQRALLEGHDPSMYPLQTWSSLPSLHYDDSDKKRSSQTSMLNQRLHDHLRRTYFRGSYLAHPFLNISGFSWTRVLGGRIPKTLINQARDSGLFRSMADGLVSNLVALIMALSHPRRILSYLSLASKLRNVRYGDHPMQTMDIYKPSPSLTAAASHQKLRMVLFIHGGAWGSGRPWMYRLLAAPLIARGYTVAIPRYRTYPDGIIQDQIDDCRSSLSYLLENYHDWCRAITLMGHSSGAHISLLMLMNLITESSSGDCSPIDSFIGISGPYDISDHFDYEANRGVEELSPMKPVCGYSREMFHDHSPARRLQKSLIGQNAKQESNLSYLPKQRTPFMFFVHGIEDTTVPFTATSKVAKTLRCCGVPICQELYIERLGHQEAIVQFMLGGTIQMTVLNLIESLDNNNKSKGKELPKPKPALPQRTVILSKL